MLDCTLLLQVLHYWVYQLGGCRFFGHAAGLVTAVLMVVGPSLVLRRFTGLAVLVLGGEEFDKTEKNLAHHRGFSRSTSNTSVEEVPSFEHSLVSYGDCKTMRYDQHDWVMFLFKTGLGWDDSRDRRMATSPGLHAWNWQVAECTCDVKCFFTHIQQRPTTTTNTIWGSSVLTGEEPPLHSGELEHALLPSRRPAQSQLSRPMSSGHHISMEHRLRRKHLNSV